MNKDQIRKQIVVTFIERVRFGGIKLCAELLKFI